MRPIRSRLAGRGDKQLMLLRPHGFVEHHDLRRQSGSPSSFLAYPGPSRNEYGYLAPNQLGYEPRKPIELAVGKAVFGSHVLPCDVAGFLLR
jgi:hypothetical protein